MDCLSQLPLGVQLQDSTTFDNFYAAEQQQMFACLQQFLASDDSFLYLWGNVGSGRSHLLQALCHQAAELNINAMYLPLAELAQMSPSLLENLEQYPLLVIDDLDYLHDKPEWQEALFHLYNRVQQQQGKLVCSALVTPQQIEFGLADLKSRLNTALVFQVLALSEADKKQVLQWRAQRRGMVLRDEVTDYLLRHYPRDLPSLFAALEKLDIASLAAKRKITIPFVKQILGEL